MLHQGPAKAAIVVQHRQTDDFPIVFPFYGTTGFDSQALLKSAVGK